MSSVLRPVRKHKKGRTLGSVEIIRREDYADLELDAKVELIRSLVPLGLMHVEEVLDEEVTALAGARYARKDASMGGRRHGSNPGTVGLAGQRVPIRVPRLRRVAGSEIPLRSYAALHGEGAVNDLLLKRVLYGISCRNDAAAAEAIPGAIGLSGSTVSRGFIEASAAKLRELQERDLAGEDVVAMVLDGKTFADATMVVALGITISGEKRFLGFVETDTENAQVLTPFLRSLVERGLDVSQGVLVILDGGKGRRSAVRKAFAPFPIRRVQGVNATACGTNRVLSCHRVLLSPLIGEYGIRAEHADADSKPCALLGAGRELRPDHTADPGSGFADTDRTWCATRGLERHYGCWWKFMRRRRAWKFRMARTSPFVQPDEDQYPTCAARRTIAASFGNGGGCTLSANRYPQRWCGSSTNVRTGLSVSGFSAVGSTEPTS